MPLPPNVKTVVRGGVKQPVVYDFVDVGSGTGVVEFYLARSYEDNTSGAFLTNVESYSNTVQSSYWGNVSQAIFTKVQDIDFDIQFRKTMNVKGNTIINIPCGIKNKADSKTFYGFIRAVLRKYNGTTETDLDSASGSLMYSGTAGDSYKYAMNCIKLSVPNNTQFSPNDTLRLTVEQYGCTAGVDPSLVENAIFFFGHDPKNRPTITGDEVTFGTEPSIASIKIPFKLDL